jgi:hypothetical protein
MPEVSAVSTRSFPSHDSTLHAVLRAWCLVVLLIYLGLMTLSVVHTLRPEHPRECGLFTVGKSRVGRCDWIG